MRDDDGGVRRRPTEERSGIRRRQRRGTPSHTAKLTTRELAGQAIARANQAR